MKKEEWIKLHAVTEVGKRYVDKYGAYAYRLFGHMYDAMIDTGLITEARIGDDLSGMFAWNGSKFGHTFWSLFYFKNMWYVQEEENENV